MRAHAERHSQSNGILLTPIFRPSEGEAPKPTITGAIMRQIEKKIKSNRNWNTPPPGTNLGNLTFVWVDGENWTGSVRFKSFFVHSTLWRKCNSQTVMLISRKLQMHFCTEEESQSTRNQRFSTCLSLIFEKSSEERCDLFCLDKCCYLSVGNYFRSCCCSL